MHCAVGYGSPTSRNVSGVRKPMIIGITFLRITTIHAPYNQRDIIRSAFTASPAPSVLITQFSKFWRQRPTETTAAGEHLSFMQMFRREMEWPSDADDLNEWTRHVRESRIERKMRPSRGRPSWGPFVSGPKRPNIRRPWRHRSIEEFVRSISRWASRFKVNYPKPGNRKTHRFRWLFTRRH